MFQRNENKGNRPFSQAKHAYGFAKLICAEAGNQQEVHRFTQLVRLFHMDAYCLRPQHNGSRDWAKDYLTFF